MSRLIHAIAHIPGFKPLIEGKISIQQLAEQSRKHLKDKGYVKTTLFGWIHEDRLSRLFQEKIIEELPGTDDYGFTTMWVDEHRVTKSGFKKPTGYRVVVLTPQARKYFDSQSRAIRKEYAQEKDLERISVEYEDEINAQGKLDF